MEELVRVSPVIAAAAARLARAGVGSPRVDAELIAAHVLDTTRGRLLLADGFGPAALARFHELVDRRAARVPLQHLTGTAPFLGLDLAVGPGVFVPRPETELLARWGIEALTGVDSPVVVDLCAGSGALGLAVHRARPDARVYAVERDPAALAWLRRNVDEQAGGAVAVVPGDVTDPAVLADLDGTVDLVLCNPPYVPDGTPVPPEVARHDPAVAVFGGPDGLDTVRGVLRRAAALLRPGGRLGLEHDDTHGTAVPALLRGHGGYGGVQAHADLAGRPRFSTARRLADCTP